MNKDLHQTGENSRTCAVFILLTQLEQRTAIRQWHRQQRPAQLMVSSPETIPSWRSAWCTCRRKRAGTLREDRGGVVAGETVKNSEVPVSTKVTSCKGHTFFQKKKAFYLVVFYLCNICKCVICNSCFLLVAARLSQVSFEKKVLNLNWIDFTNIFFS